MQEAKEKLFNVLKKDGCQNHEDALSLVPYLLDECGGITKFASKYNLSLTQALCLVAGSRSGKESSLKMAEAEVSRTSSSSVAHKVQRAAAAACDGDDDVVIVELRENKMKAKESHLIQNPPTSTEWSSYLKRLGNNDERVYFRALIKYCGKKENAAVGIMTGEQYIALGKLEIVAKRVLAIMKKYRKATFNVEHPDTPEALVKAVRFATIEAKNRGDKDRIIQEVLFDFVKEEIKKKYSQAVYHQTRGKGGLMRKSKKTVQISAKRQQEAASSPAGLVKEKAIAEGGGDDEDYQPTPDEGRDEKVHDEDPKGVYIYIYIIHTL